MKANKLTSINIIEENPGFIVVYKPAGLAIQDEPNQPGLIHILKKQLGYDNLHPVHRLDKLTTGLVLVAKNKEWNQKLSVTFQNKAVEKFYLAISSRKPKKKQGLLKGDMEKARGGAWKLTNTKNNPALTQFFSYGLVDDRQAGLRLFLVKPHTGKTHQIRVALKSLGAPIVGDSLYGGDESDRLYLHAYALRFKVGDQCYSFCCKPWEGLFFCSDAFSDLLNKIGLPEDIAWPELKR